MVNETMRAAAKEIPNDPDSTPEVRSFEEGRKLEVVRAALGINRWTLAAQHTESEEYVGTTAISIDMYEPEILHQGDTAVLPRFRKRGLGRWIKAEMMERVLGNLSDARFIHTGNISENESILQVNREMGFLPYQTMNHWLLEVKGPITCISTSCKT